MRKRESIVLIIICGSLFAAFISWNGVFADTGQPMAVLPETQYKFQPVPDGTQINHSFKIQNKGTAPLNIQKVRTG